MQSEIVSNLANGIELLTRSTSQSYYLDPGSGSFLIQLLAATFLGSLFIIRSNWAKLVTFFKKRFGQSNEETDSDNEIQES